MRKVLLASTALFALGSVSAMAADITISGSTEIVLDMGDSATPMTPVLHRTRHCYHIF